MEFIEAKSILQSAGANHSSWFGLDYNMNLYKGCCHGCIYCDSRSRCYQIIDFDRVRIKKNCLDILHKELKGRRKTGVIGIGAMSDTYNPFEQKYEITRQALQLIHSFGFGVSIDTKSDLITRDIDILSAINQVQPVIAKLTITTADDQLSQQIEPYVCPSSARFKAIAKLSDAGIFTGVLMGPILPYIDDREEQIKVLIETAAKHGANFVYPSLGVTLRDNQREYYYQKLDDLFPGTSTKYKAAFGNSYYCNSPRNKDLYSVVARECKKYGLFYKMDDIIKGYKDQSDFEQLTLSF